MGVVAFLILAPGASADVVLKASPTSYTATSNCFPSGVTPAYAQQTSAPGNTTGIEPRVGDVFYMSLRVDLTQLSFTCAADFTSVLATLPSNVAPAISGSATTICRRWGFNSAGNQVSDNRAQTNCAANPSYDAGTHQLSMRPVNSPAVPDSGTGAPGSGYWFTGIRSPQESQSYMSLQLLVPIKATATMTNQPISFLVCTVGTNCINASVNLTVTAGPIAADPPLVSLPSNGQVSATGARVPFTINDVAGGSYFMKTDIATDTGYVNRPCGLMGPQYYAAQNSPIVPYTGQTNSEIQYGDLQVSGVPCNLAPQTLYYYTVCSTNTTLPGPPTDLNCRYSSFTTGAVASTMELPASDPQPSTTLTAQTRVLAGHPAGSTKVQRRYTADGGGFTDATSSQAVTQSTSSSPQVGQSVSLPLPWWSYDLRTCFTAPTSCTPPVTYLAGAAHSNGEATDVTSTTATVKGGASTPYPEGNMVARIGTADPGVQDPKTALTQVGGTTPVAANNTTGPSPSISIPLTGLTPNTTYYWAACFDNTNQAGLEDCGAARSFTTAAPPTCTEDPSQPSCQEPTCAEDPSQSKCQEPTCAQDPTQSKCQDPTCAEDPSQAKCQSGGQAKLVVAKPKKLKVKAGKSGKLAVSVSNTGMAEAAGAKLCATVPKKFKKTVKVPACVTLGTVASGKTVVSKLKVKVSKKAKKGACPVSLVAKWSPSKSSAKVKGTITIRK